MVYFKPLKPHGDMVFGKPVSEGHLPELQHDDPVMLKTSIMDVESNILWEGDICDCGVVTSYGVVRERGIVVWRADLNQFSINLKKSYEGQIQFDIVEQKRIGNMYEHPDLVKQ